MTEQQISEIQKLHKTLSKMTDETDFYTGDDLERLGLSPTLLDGIYEELNRVRAVLREAARN